MLDFLVRLLLRVFIRIEGREEMEKVPLQGPALVVMNHINFLEAPLFYNLYKPRPMWAMAKTELWSNPFFGVFVRRWGAIAVKRGGSNRETFALVKKLLDKGHLVALAPEGTRSRRGTLQRGKPGIAILAHETGVPVIPVAHWGGQNFWRNARHLKPTTIHLRVGTPFIPEAALGKTARQDVADQVMLHIAHLMPPELQGYYSQKIMGN